MLRVGLTGGTGAGKSTAARRLAELGAVVVDADALAREVVAPGAPGLAAVVRAFGDGVLAPDGSLDRAALGAVVFADTGRRRELEAITHPLVRARREELVAQAPPGAVVVDDIPLLVETGRGAEWPLVAVVDAPVEVRVARLVAARGTAEADARARVASQASDAERRAAADVVLVNDGPPEALRDAVDRLWRERLVPFEEALRRGGGPPGAARAPGAPPDPASVERVLARVRRAAGERARSVRHVDPALDAGAADRDASEVEPPAVDVLAVEVVVADAAAAEAVADDLRAAGLVRPAREHRGAPRADGAVLLVGADPGRAVDALVRPADGPSGGGG